MASRRATSSRLKVHPVHHGHLPVEQHQIEGFAARIRFHHRADGRGAIADRAGLHPQVAGHLQHHQACAFVVVHDEHTGSLQRITGGGIPDPFVTDPQAQAEVEDAALAQRAPQRERAAHHPHEVLADGQAQAGATEASAGG